jgi:hypothetical protein
MNQTKAVVWRYRFNEWPGGLALWIVFFLFSVEATHILTTLLSTEVM